MPGVSRTRLDTGKRGASTPFSLALDFLRRLAAPTGAPWTGSDAESWDFLFARRIGDLSGLADRRGRLAALTDLASRLESVLRPAGVPRVLFHGNYWAGNLLFDHDGRLTGVVDWDLAETPGPAMLDALHLWAREEALARGLGIGDAVLRCAGRLQRREPLPEAFEEYAEAVGVAQRLWPALLVCDWVVHVHQHIEYRTGSLENPSWLERNIDRFLDRSQSLGL